MGVICIWSHYSRGKIGYTQLHKVSAQNHLNDLAIAVVQLSVQVMNVRTLDT